MLRVNYISNVNSTLKSGLSFGTGVRTNYGVKPANDNLVDQSILTGFVGVLKDSPFFSKISSRAESIEKGLNTNEVSGKKLDKIA